MSDLKELLERVEGAGGPDRELDRDIACALVPGICPEPAFGPGGVWADRMPAEVDTLTASLDAALALVERVLPDVDRELDVRLRIHGAHVKRYNPHKGYWEVTETTTPALAVLSSLLRALIAKEPASPSDGERT